MELSPGTGIIYEDPQFINLEQLNFELSDTSPCINSGDPEQELDNDGTISDIGANTYNNQFCSDLGDLNYDNNIDVVDVIVLVNCILLNESCSICFDINQDNEFNILDIYNAVVSPSTLASVAIMSSKADWALPIRESIFNSSGPIPSKGEINPPRT